MKFLNPDLACFDDCQAAIEQQWNSMDITLLEIRGWPAKWSLLATDIPFESLRNDVIKNNIGDIGSIPFCRQSPFTTH